MTLLKNIVRIQTGVYLKPYRFENAVCIRLKDVDVKGQLSPNPEPDIFINERLTHHSIKAGSILTAPKEDNSFAFVYNEEYPAAIAASSFLAQKHSFQILSEYLTWFINHPDSQEKLKAKVKNSSITSISIKSLNSLKIKVLDKSLQHPILKLNILRKKGKDIQLRIMQLKDHLIDSNIINRI